MTIREWMENMIEEVEGQVRISCVMEQVPWHDNTSRYQVYNEEGTYNELFDITIDNNGKIISVK